jgi:hypothetical protein
MPGDVTRNYRIRYGVVDTASIPIGKLGAAVTALEVGTLSLAASMRQLDLGLQNAAEGAIQLDGAARSLTTALGQLSPKLSALSGTLRRVDTNAREAAVSAQGLGTALGALSGQAAGVGVLQQAVQRTQRSMYGMAMNARDATAAMTALGATAPGVTAAGTATAGLRAGLGGARVQGAGLGLAMGSIVGHLAGLGSVLLIARGLGESFKDARQFAAETAAEATKLRDTLREVANLRGKPGADDAVTTGQLALRMGSGMRAPEARQFEEQFLGSLPLSKEKGGITDKVADELARETARLAVRTGLEGKTAGDLAGSLGMFGKVPDARVGLGRVQQIVDQLNDGRGNLTPLTAELMKDAAATVGQGGMFRTIQDRAAAIGTATAMGSIGRTSTRVNQAIAGLSNIEGQDDKGATLRGLGIEGTDDLLARLEKIAPMVNSFRAEGLDPLGELKKRGFNSQVQQKAIIGFVDNLPTLRTRMAAVREDPAAPDARSLAAADRSGRLNDQFFAGDKAARERVADATMDAARFFRGRKDEHLEIERKRAEAQLLHAGQMDTPGDNFVDRMMDGFGILPGLGMKTNRQARIDSQVKANAGMSGNFEWFTATRTAAEAIAARDRAALGEAPAAPKLPPIPAMVRPPAVGEPGEEPDGEPEAPPMVRAPAMPGALGNPALPFARIVMPPHVAESRVPWSARPGRKRRGADSSSRARPNEGGDPGLARDLARERAARVKPPAVRLPRPGMPSIGGLMDRIWMGGEPPRVRAPRVGLPSAEGAPEDRPPARPTAAEGGGMLDLLMGTGGGPGGADAPSMLRELIALTKQANEQRSRQADRTLPGTPLIFPER